MTRAAGALLCFSLLLSAAIAAPVPAPTPAPGPAANSAAVLAHGRYLVTITGCNDCHTAGWRESDGNVPTRDWLTGSRVGFRGAWGTSYPTNLRIEFQIIAEDEWENAVGTRGVHSMMNWGDLRALTPADRHAIYAFVRSLGPAGAPSLPDVKPWVEPRTPYIDLRERLPQH